MRCEATFTGRVQGVGFRVTAHRIAQELGVVGWVRNEPDGSVMLVAEADQATLEKYMDRLCKQMGDFITHSHRDQTPERGEYTGFEVRC